EGWATNLDVQADQSIAAYTFVGCYFESATHSIVRRSIAPAGGHDTLGITFQACAMRNLSKLRDPNYPDVTPSDYMLDLSQIGGTVALINCWYDSAPDASDTINVGPQSKVIIVGSGNGRSPAFAGNTAAVSSYREGFAAINTAATSNPLIVNSPLADDPRALVLVSSSQPSDKPLVVQGVADQAERLTEWQNADGGPVAFVSSAGRMFSDSGTASTPAFGNAADTRTGMFFPAAGSVAWTVDGAMAMRLTSSGLVMGNRAIGDVADPIAPQDVATKSYVDSQIQAMRENSAE
ncbi:hypothetical protein, partial [Jiangella aurantiaca]|uniref:hypothetical protein n=1 Tax=Jiangella aurantiaca TaxID=2530373 RepID=UPI0013A5D389